MPVEGLSLANLESFIGLEIGVSEWVTLTQERINQFADCTGDQQWIHVDADRAAASPFGTTIAHGYLTLALLAQSTFELIVKPTGIGAALNYGLDRVRFLAPVKSGSRVRNRMRLLTVEDKGNGRLLLTTENAIEIEGETKPALIANALIMAMPA